MGIVRLDKLDDKKALTRLDGIGEATPTKESNADLVRLDSLESNPARNTLSIKDAPLPVDKISSSDRASLISGPMGVAQKIIGDKDTVKALPLEKDLASGAYQSLSAISSIPAAGFSQLAYGHNLYANAAKSLGSDLIPEIKIPKILRDNSVTRFFGDAASANNILSQDPRFTVSREEIDAFIKDREEKGITTSDKDVQTFVRKNTPNMVTLASKGKIKEAAEYAIHNVVQNIPYNLTLLAMMMAGTKGLPILATTAEYSAGANIAQGGTEKLNATEETQVNVLKSFAEAGSEFIGSIPTFKYVSDLFKTVGVKNGASALYSTLKGLIASSMAEGGEEIVSSIVQSLVDKYYALEDDLTYKEIALQALNAGGIGFVSGGILEFPGAMTHGLSRAINNNTNYEKITQSIQDEKEAEQVVENLKAAGIDPKSIDPKRQLPDRQELNQIIATIEIAEKGLKDENGTLILQPQAISVDQAKLKDTAEQMKASELYSDPGEQNFEDNIAPELISQAMSPQEESGVIIPDFSSTEEAFVYGERNYGNEDVIRELFSQREAALQANAKLKTKARASAESMSAYMKAVTRAQLYREALQKAGVPRQFIPENASEVGQTGKTIDEAIKAVEYDSQNQMGISSQVGVGKEYVKAKPKQGRSGAPVSGGRVFQKENENKISEPPAQYGRQFNEPSEIDIQPSGQIKNAALKIKMKKQGYLQFARETIQSPADVAYAFRQLKNEAVERAFVVGIKDGRAVYVEPLHIGTMTQGYLEPFDALPFLLQTECDSFALVHNHPSGDIAASRADYSVTEQFKNAFSDQGINFLGHIIINDTKFGHINPDLSYDAIEHTKEATGSNVALYSKYIEWTGSKESAPRITSSSDVYSLAKGALIDNQSNAYILYLNNQNRVMGSEIVPVSKIDYSHIGRNASGLRANGVILVNSNLGQYEVNQLSNKLKTFKIRLLDSVYLKGSGFIDFVSFADQGRISEDRAGYTQSERKPGQIKTLEEFIENEIDKKYQTLDTKIVDESGLPKYVYHGGNKGIQKFDLERSGEETGAINTKLGVFFTTEESLAERYAGGGSGVGEVYEAFIEIKNPYKLTATTDYDVDASPALNKEIADYAGKDIADITSDDANDFKESLIRKGFDGIEVLIDKKNDDYNYVVFSPEQIYILNKDVQQLTDIWNKAHKGIAEQPSQYQVSEKRAKYQFDDTTQKIFPTLQSIDPPFNTVEKAIEYGAKNRGNKLLAKQLDAESKRLQDIIDKLKKLPRTTDNANRIQSVSELYMAYRASIKELRKAPDATSSLTVNSTPGEISRATVEALKTDLQQDLRLIEPASTFDVGGTAIGKTFEPAEFIEDPTVSNIIKNGWIGKKQAYRLRAEVLRQKIEQFVAKATKTKLGKDSKQWERALTLYHQFKGNLEELQAYAENKSITDTTEDPGSSLSGVKGETKVDLKDAIRKALIIESNPQLKQLSEQMTEHLDALQQIANENGLTMSYRENYIRQLWSDAKKRGRPKSDTGGKFKTKTAMQKHRIFNNYIEGILAGYTPKSLKFSDLIKVYDRALTETLLDKQFLNLGSHLEDMDGNKLFVTQGKNVPDGYELITHPSFKLWRYAGKVNSEDEANEVRATGVFISEDGTILQEKLIYAPKDIAQIINNVLSYNKLTEDIPVLKHWLKINNFMKRRIFTYSVFHHFALMRSALMAGEINPISAYQKGLDYIKSLNPILMTLSENGLTIGQGEGKIFFEAAKKAGFRGKWDSFLWDNLYDGLKAEVAVHKFEKLMKDNPDADVDAIAQEVANFVNNDFGGLNLERMGRSPIVQKLMQIAFLSPDWTESNWRTLTNVFTAKGETQISREQLQARRKIHLMFWRNIAITSTFALVFLNKALADKWPWENDKFHELELDITKLAKWGQKLLGVEETKDRVYFSVMGHLLDAIKWASRPDKTIAHKLSPLLQAVNVLVSGKDWQGRPYATNKELLKYQRVVRGNYEMATDFWESSITRGIGAASKTIPIPLQSLFNYLSGQATGLESISTAAGQTVKEQIPKSRLYYDYLDYKAESQAEGRAANEKAKAYIRQGRIEKGMEIMQNSGKTFRQIIDAVETAYAPLSAVDTHQAFIDYAASLDDNKRKKLYSDMIEEKKRFRLELESLLKTDFAGDSEIIKRINKTDREINDLEGRVE